MKKSIALLLVLLLALSLGACKKQEADPAPAPLPSIDGPLNESDDIAGSPFVGLFKNSYSALFKSAARDVYPEPNCPVPELRCEADGAFTFTVVSAVEEKSYVMTGSFTVDGDTATFTVAERQDSFFGDDVESFTMTLVSENELRYAGDQMESVAAGDIFERN